MRLGDVGAPRTHSIVTVVRQRVAAFAADGLALWGATRGVSRKASKLA